MEFKPKFSQREASLAKIFQAYPDLDIASKTALARFYEVVYKYHSPFISHNNHRIIKDAAEETENGTSDGTVFLYSDGQVFGIFTSILEPEFYRQHCREAVISRIIVERAIQDMERNSEIEFPQLAEFRYNSEAILETDVTGSLQTLTNYLEFIGVPVSKEGKNFDLVDIGTKGTIQEF